MKKMFIEIFGWYGTCVIILAYALVSFGWVEGSGFIYQFLNFSGAIGIIAVSLSKKVYQSVVLNAIWTAIALVVLVKIIL